MIIKSIRLKNIRSYSEAEINFPHGNVLLKGDVGSGKSTILLAIEFALFGLLRGEYSGSTLLRNGNNEGHVECCFEIEGKEVTIKRKLVRGKQRIEQDSGHIIINGLKKDASAVELKALLIDILGYPKELITKSKNLIYKYTVYTPQEEMKKILFETKEIRLDILRKIFNIDKYKRIRENCIIVLQTVKEKIKEHEGNVFDLDIKKNQLQNRKNELLEIENNSQNLKTKVEDKRNKVNETKKKFEEINNEKTEYEKLRHNIILFEVTIKHKNERALVLETEIKKTEEELLALKNLEGYKIEDCETFIELIKKTIATLDLEIKELRKKHAEVNLKKVLSDSLIVNINKLQKCPTCYQEVNENHKNLVHREEKEKIENLFKEMQEIEKNISDKEKIKNEKIKEIEELQKKEKEQILTKYKLQNLEEKKKNLTLKNVEKELLKNDVKEQTTLLNELKLKIIEVEKKISNYEIIKKQFETAESEFRREELKFVEFVEKKKMHELLINELEQEIIKKQEVKNKKIELEKFKQWIDDVFLNILIIMEKQVMAKIYREFNEFFKQWFSILLEDENIDARLDDAFAPVVRQNGYDIDFENLSGGEKTALALAYRLALNKVINYLIGTIKTSDLLILDEPTDGFSSEQLDKMKDVIDQLGLKQVIIVSHEQKIGSMVDSIINVAKEESVSKITY